MKILFYSPHPTHDIVTEVGYATHQRETIWALQKSGAVVLPLVMGGTTLEEVPYKEGKAIKATGLKGLLKSLIPGFIWVSLKDLKLMLHDKKAGRILEKAIIEHKPDLIYERSEYLQDSGVAPAKRHGIPYFVEVNAPFVEEMKEMQGKSCWARPAHHKERKKYKAADRIFVVSTALKEFLISRYKINSGKIIVSPNRINVKKFLERAEEKSSIVNQFKFKQAPVIGFVGSILPHHYVEVLIDAYGILRKKGVKASLLIVGGGTFLEELEKQAVEQNLSEEIKFTGKVPHKFVPALIKEMDICVMPGSNWYGSPVKIFEYGILGKAVIAPDNVPVRDVMVDGEDGLLIERDPNVLAEALIKLIEDKDLRTKLGENFRKKIISEYTWEKAADMILDEFNSIKSG
jgi:glycosyltransferase involved in cell wall biosynthesis